jgi:radical SAM protein (TIGR01212 family)
MSEPFTSYSRYLRDRYGGPVQRVAVDGGFSCPNRGPDRSAPGCAYCDAYGSRAPYLRDLDRGRAQGGPTAEAHGRPTSAAEGAADRRSPRLQERLDSVTAQVKRAESFLRARYGPGERILYFQAFSGTYGSVAELRRLYDHALALGRFRELIVATRPDCVAPETAELLAGYQRPGREVWVELGLQSANDATLERIGRGHTVARFGEAFSLLRGRGIKVAAHVIFGLPGEGLVEILSTIRYLAGLEVNGLKIHNLHVPRDCPMAAEALSGELTVPCAARHLEYVAHALELLPPHTVIMRLTCDTPEDRLLLPQRFLAKAAFYEQLRSLMRREGMRQGRLWRPAEG